MTSLVQDALVRLQEVDGVIVDDDGKPFDLVSYSRFKYGEASMARAYGYGLAHMFIDRHSNLANDPRRLLVTSAPYKFVSTASDGVLQHFMVVLNAYRVKRGLEPAMKLHIIRFKIGTDHYAQSSLGERKLQYGKTPRHVDAGLIRDSNVVAIDDARITGSTEHRMRDVLLPCEPAAICFIHAVRFDETWACDEDNGGIEDVMNKTFKTTLDTIAADIEAGNFRLNTRVFRTMMGWKDDGAFYQFLCKRSDAFVMELYAALVSGMVEMYRRFPDGTKQLERVVTERKLLEIAGSAV